jgi:hypothetical protein
MTDPTKVLGFLDLAGAWDPSLAFVMGGAIAVAFGRLPHRVSTRQGLVRRAASPADPQGDRRPLHVIVKAVQAARIGQVALDDG